MTIIPKAALTLGALSLALTLAGCKKVESESEVTAETNGEKRTVTITKSTDSISSSSASASSSSSSSNSTDGEDSLSMSFNEDGFNLDIDVPIDEWTNDKANASDGLYPGSQVTNVSVITNTQNGISSGQVSINFTARTDPDTVANWMAQNIRKKGGKAARKGNIITATDKDGDDYRVTLKANGDKTDGRMVVSGQT